MPVVFPMTTDNIIGRGGVIVSDRKRQNTEGVKVSYHKHLLTEKKIQPLCMQSHDIFKHNSHFTENR